MAIQSERSFSGAKFNISSRNNWKLLLEVNFVKNSTKTIRYPLSISYPASRGREDRRDLCSQGIDFYLNNRVFLSRNYRLIVAPRKFDVLKTNICPRSEASRENMLVLRTSNFQFIRLSLLFTTKFSSARWFKNLVELFSTVLDESR